MSNSPFSAPRPIQPGRARPAPAPAAASPDPAGVGGVEGWANGLPLYRAARQRWLLAIVLFALTLATTTTLGAAWYLATRTDVTTDLLPVLSVESTVRVWTDPALRATGLAFSLPVLFILLCHELGHYLTCRWYGLPATLPYFLPAPVGLGTLGAFIKIRAPIRTKRELLDVGASGPIAGFLALLPFLFYGVAQSQPAAIRLASSGMQTGLLLYLPGKCLALDLATRWFHGPLPEGMVLDLHPFALAAWVGLLATALNLLPLGQLDGGHILYAVLGRRQRLLAPVLWVGLAGAAFFWRGWLLWCAIVFVMGLRHPPVYDETSSLDPRRRLIALATLALFALSFMPNPLSVVSIE